MIKKILIGLSILVLGFFMFTYGRWELLTLIHADKFESVIKSAVDDGCLLGYPETIKVMEYSGQNAMAFTKDYTGTTFLVDFYKSNGEWTMLSPIEGSNDQYVCHFWVLNSTMGGSADNWLYWYF